MINNPKEMCIIVPCRTGRLSADYCFHTFDSIAVYAAVQVGTTDESINP
jgi:hypothetical protein